jgi:hypothetical protein
MQNGERTFPNFPALPRQTTPGRLMVTKWHWAAGPSLEHYSLPLSPDRSCSPGRI